MRRRPRALARRAGCQISPVAFAQTVPARAPNAITVMMLSPVVGLTSKRRGRAAWRVSVAARMGQGRTSEPRPARCEGDGDNIRVNQVAPGDKRLGKASQDKRTSAETDSNAFRVGEGARGLGVGAQRGQECHLGPQRRRLATVCTPLKLASDRARNSVHARRLS